MSILRKEDLADYTKLTKCVGIYCSNSLFNWLQRKRRFLNLTVYIFYMHNEKIICIPNWGKLQTPPATPYSFSCYESDLRWVITWDRIAALHHHQPITSTAGHRPLLLINRIVSERYTETNHRVTEKSFRPENNVK